ncbi:MAG: hypothetical protein GXP49_11305 [Deltaproteobacteria bacterium]|nr:hypothetical protein [Deltaproteobacteria bacterium]
MTGFLIVSSFFPAACSETRDEHSDEFLLAQSMLKEAQLETADPSYVDPRFDKVVDAFKKVPRDAPDRYLAEFWIERINEARRSNEKLRRESKIRAEAIVRELTASKNQRPFSFKSILSPVRQRQVIHGTSSSKDIRPGEKEKESEEYIAATDRDRDNFGRGKDYWRRKKTILFGTRKKLEETIALEEKRVATYCGGTGMTWRLSGTRKSSPVHVGSLSDYSHPPERIDVVDPTRKACTIHGKALKKMRKELKSIQEQIDRLDDEARKAGALPGWLRVKGLEKDVKKRGKARPGLPPPPPAVSPSGD